MTGGEARKTQDGMLRMGCEDMASRRTDPALAGMTRRGFIASASMAAAGAVSGLVVGCSARAGDAPTDVRTDILREATDGTDAASIGAEATVAGDGDRTPGGFVAVRDVAPDVMEDMRYFGTYNFVGERIDGYDEPLAILSAEAADALRLASDEAVSRGYRLKVFDCYRPTRAVEHFARWAEGDDERMREFFFPETEKGWLFDLGYVARRSGHSRGSTVDLTLFDMAAGRDADMGGTFDLFGDVSHPGFAGIGAGQRESRMLLREIMGLAGFVPMETEWWHFCLRDEPYPDTYFDFPVARGSLGGDSPA